MRSQRVLGLTLRTVVGPVVIRVGYLFGILLDGACKGVKDLHKNVLRNG